MINLNTETFVAAVTCINLCSIGIYATVMGRNRSRATKAFLLIFCVSLALSQWYDVLTFNEVYGRYLRYLDELSLLTAFSTLYFYVLSLTLNPFKFQRKHALHALPILLFLMIWVFPLPGIEQFHESRALRLFYSFYNHLQGIVYVVLIHRLVSRHGRLLPELSSTARENDLRWVRVMVILLLALIFLWTWSGVVDDVYNVVGYGLLIFSYWLGYHMISQKSIYLNMPPAFELTELKDAGKKYKNSTLSPSDKEQFAARIRYMMETEKPHLNNELTLNSLADRLDMKPIHLSQVLNENFDENFYTFINRHRVEESKRLLIDPRYSHYSILGIALDAGFNSKSTFNKAFKDAAGISPSEFQRAAKTSV